MGKGNERLRSVLLVALAAAIVAGTITGTQLTVEDDGWPARGGFKAVVQISALFTAYALAVAVPVGLLLNATIGRRMGKAGLVAHALAGAAIGCVVHLIVFLAIRERIDASEDWLGGTVAGAVAGALWWNLSRRKERKAMAHG